ncbi:hypothetical protein ACVK1X_001064 [Pseudomonas sp. PvR086]
MECFRIDESGYTGFDLLNDAQPFQGASAIVIDDAEAARLIRDYFPKLQAPELKYRSLSKRATLSDLVTAARQTDWRKLSDAMWPLVHSDPDCLAAIATPGVTTDMALPVLMALISQMELMSDGPYRVEHDQSKNLLTYHDLLQRQIDHTYEAEFRQSALASIRYPLKLSEVTQVDSKTSPAVQLADVLIGATIESAQRMTGRIADGLDPQRLGELYRDDQLIHMLPSLDLEEQREFRKGTQAAALIDYFAENFSSPR